MPRSPPKRLGEYTFNVDKIDKNSTNNFVSPQPPEPNRVISLNTNLTDEEFVYSSTYDFGMDIDILLGESHTSRRFKRNKRKGDGTPPRPQNEFMLFRRSLAAKLKKNPDEMRLILTPMLIGKLKHEEIKKLFETPDKVKSALISKVAGTYWKEVGKEIKHLFEVAGRVALKIFLTNHPDYKYKPKRTSATPYPSPGSNTMDSFDNTNSLDDTSSESSPSSAGVFLTTANDYTICYNSPIFYDNYNTSVLQGTAFLDPTYPSPTISSNCSSQYASPIYSDMDSPTDNFEDMKNFSPLSSINPIHKDEVQVNFNENEGLEDQINRPEDQVAPENILATIFVNQPFALEEYVTDTNQHLDYNYSDNLEEPTIAPEEIIGYTSNYVALGMNLPDDNNDYATDMIHNENEDSAKYCCEDDFQNEILNSLTLSNV